MVSAVVFGYHNVGYRCLSVLLAHNIHVKLVVTHEDDEDENIWFDSVAGLASLHNIPVIAPKTPNNTEVISQIASLSPDLIFSFYYRKILSVEILQIARLGCYNMHGSLLPKYRGRAPVNWAIVNGETEIGATLHEMVQKPDAGAIVGQMPVPILPDDTAADVFSKVVVAAELVLNSTLPGLVQNSIERIPLDIASGSYFGGRKPQDGVIKWKSMGAQEIHNLVRAVSRPYPGAFTETPKGTLVIWRTLVVKDEGENCPRSMDGPHLWYNGNQIFATAADGGILRVISAELNGQPLDAGVFAETFGQSFSP